MTRRIMRTLKLTEISAVDRPCQEGARMTIMKRVTDEYWKRDFTQAQRDAAASSGAAMGDGSFPIENTSDLKNAIHAVGRASDPAKAKAHIISRAKSLGATDLLPNDWVGKNVGTPDNGDEDMSADTEKKVGELSQQIADLTKKLDAAEKSAAESAVLKTQLDTLTKSLDELKKASDPEKAKKDAETKKAFDEAVKAEVDKQVAAEIAKREEVDKNDETIEIDGVTVRKSQAKDPQMFALLKAQTEKSQMAEFTKRAETEIKYLPGETLVKAKALRAVSKIANKEDREAVETMLKAAQAFAVTAMKTLGKDGASEGSSEAELAKRAGALAIEKKIDKNAAMAQLLETPEGKELYAKSLSEKPAA